MKTKPPSAFQVAKARKARAHFMNRSNAALKLMNTRAPHGFSLDVFRTMVSNAIGSPCPYCGDIIKAKTFSPDHRVPLSREGKPVLANIQIVCLKDNHSKGALTDGEFQELLSLIRQWDPVAQNDVLGRLRLGAAAKARWSRRWAKK